MQPVSTRSTAASTPCCGKRSDREKNKFRVPKGNSKTCTNRNCDSTGSVNAVLCCVCTLRCSNVPFGGASEPNWTVSFVLTVGIVTMDLLKLRVMTPCVSPEQQTAFNLGAAVTSLNVVQQNSLRCCVPLWQLMQLQQTAICPQGNAVTTNTALCPQGNAHNGDTDAVQRL